MAVCTNAENTAKHILKEFKLSKNINDGDFQWLMRLYVSICIMELYDLFDHVRRGADDRLKSVLDVNREQAVDHFKRILGGDDIEKFSEITLKFIESLDKESKDLDEYMIKRTAFIFKSFQDGGVSAPLVKNLDVQKISNEVYRNSLMNFVALCVR